MNTRFTYVALLAVALTGCASRSYEEVAADNCLAAGYVRGSEPHTRCTVQLAERQRQRDFIARQNVSSALIAAGAVMMATPAAQPPQPPRQEVYTCTSANNGLYRSANTVYRCQ